MTNWNVEVPEIKKNLKKGDYNSIGKYLAKLDWKATFNDKSVTVRWDTIFLK